MELESHFICLIVRSTGGTKIVLDVVYRNAGFQLSVCETSCAKYLVCNIALLEHFITNVADKIGPSEQKSNNTISL